MSSLSDVHVLDIRLLTFFSVRFDFQSVAKVVLRLVMQPCRGLISRQVFTCPLTTAQSFSRTLTCSRHFNPDTTIRTLPFALVFSDTTIRTLLFGHYYSDTTIRTLQSGHYQSDTTIRTLQSGHFDLGSSFRSL